MSGRSGPIAGRSHDQGDQGEQRDPGRFPGPSVRSRPPVFDRGRAGMCLGIPWSPWSQKGAKSDRDRWDFRTPVTESGGPVLRGCNL